MSHRHQSAAVVNFNQFQPFDPRGSDSHFAHHHEPLGKTPNEFLVTVNVPGCNGRWCTLSDEVERVPNTTRVLLATLSIDLKLRCLTTAAPSNSPALPSSHASCWCTCLPRSKHHSYCLLESRTPPSTAPSVLPFVLPSFLRPHPARVMRNPQCETTSIHNYLVSVVHKIALHRQHRGLLAIVPRCIEMESPTARDGEI